MFNSTKFTGKEKAAMGAAGLAGAAAAPAVATAAVNAVGFGAGGVVAGSLAASAQGTLPAVHAARLGLLLNVPNCSGAAVASGSVFAAAQSIGATGSLAYLGAGAAIPVVGVGLLAFAAVGGLIMAIKKASSVIDETAAESLIQAVTMCRDPNTNWWDPDTQKKLEEKLRDIKRRWKELEKYLVEHCCWNEPFIGLGSFQAFPGPKILASLANYLEANCKLE